VASALQTSALMDLDFLLTKITEDLQLTPTQYDNAVEKYGAVAKWVQAPNSALAYLAPDIYPQGSMALRTTLRPRGRVEYDLDLVCEMKPTSLSAMELYELLYSRLYDSPHYRPIIEKLNRCVRLNYAGDFHLDVIPARPDGGRQPSIYVPDRTLRDWTPSNPRGFIAWFETRARQAEVLRGVTPLPSPLSPGQRSTLAVAVQLIKRRRDIMFDGDGKSPRSILLTTLAGHAYVGEEHVAVATFKIMRGIDALIQAAAPRRIDVRNPTNNDESFTESFDDVSYRAFCRFVSTFAQEMASLVEVRGGFPALQRELATMFGETPVFAALRALAETASARRPDGLRFGAGGGLSIVGNAHETPLTVPRNSFFGEQT
jgi:hypothetical protein